MPNSDIMGNMLSQGNTAEIFERDEDKILKLYRPEMPEDFYVYEFGVMQYVYEHLKIAPKPIETVNINSRIGAVYERINGITMLKLMLVNPWKLHKYAKLLALWHIVLQRPVTIAATTVKEKLRREIESVSLLSINKKSLIYKLFPQ
ncbi:hypothetical protein FACS189415_7200 [Bacteroidia bacterium]|nr:hypothetical protein FACS189415_7200 [Bacteroidia bacterium]